VYVRVCASRTYVAAAYLFLFLSIPLSLSLSLSLSLFQPGDSYKRALSIRIVRREGENGEHLLAPYPPLHRPHQLLTPLPRPLDIIPRCPCDHAFPAIL